MRNSFESENDVPITQARWVRLLLLLGLPALVLCGLLLFRHSKISQAISNAQAHEGSAQDFQKWAQEAVTDWSKKEYAPLGNLKGFTNALFHAAVGGPPLDSIQKRSFFDTLTHFFLTYTEGGLERWKAWRFTEDNLPHELTSEGTWQLELYNGSFAEIKKQSIPDLLPRDEDATKNWMRQYLDRDRAAASGPDDQFAAFFAGITGGQGYSNYFSGACLREIILNHDIYETDPPPLASYPFFPFSVQKGHAADATFPNQGFFHWENDSDKHAYFRVHPTARELLAQHGRIDCVSVFIFTKLNDPGKVTPLLLRYFWNPASKRWLIDSMVDGNLFGRRKVLMFM